MPTRPPKFRPSQQHRFRSEAKVKASSAERGYGTLWQKLRASVLRREPLCRECQRFGRVTAAQEVDHIIEKADGGTDDPDNLQPLCVPCHRRKSNDERRRRKAIEQQPVAAVELRT